MSETDKEVRKNIRKSAQRKGIEYNRIEAVGM